MKKYVKPQMMAKNAPVGSYAAGCPEKDRGFDHGSTGCTNCERTK